MRVGDDELNEKLIEMVIFSTKFEEFRKELICVYSIIRQHIYFIFSVFFSFLF